MPTFNRREFIPAAVECFLSQSYPEKELVVVDNGDSILDLLPANTTYLHVGHERRSTGWMRNRACSIARGTILANWDDDDWSHPRRLQDQYKRLAGQQTGIVGYSSMYFLDEQRQQAWLYSGDADYALGTSLCYSRTYWKANKYPDKLIGEDEGFIEHARRNRAIVTAPANDRMVARIHPKNTSPKQDISEICEPWYRADYERVRSLMVGGLVAA